MESGFTQNPHNLATVTHLPVIWLEAGFWTKTKQGRESTVQAKAKLIHAQTPKDLISSLTLSICSYLASVYKTEQDRILLAFL